MSSGVVPRYMPCLLAWYYTKGHACWSVCTSTNNLTSWVQTEGEWLQVLQRCHYIMHVYLSGATLTYACLYSAILSDMHAGFIHSDAHACKVLLHQARYLVCYKSIRHAYRLGAAPTGLLNLSATIMDAILNISNSEWCISCFTGMLQGWCL